MFIDIRGEYSRGGVHIPTPSKNNLFSTGGGRFNHPIHFLFTIFIIFLFFTYFCCQINIYHLPIFCYRGNVINLITYTPAAHSLKSAKQLGDGGIHHPLRRIRKNGKKYVFTKKYKIILQEILIGDPKLLAACLTNAVVRIFIKR